MVCAVVCGYVLWKLHLSGRESIRVNSLTGGSEASSHQRKGSSLPVGWSCICPFLWMELNIADCGLIQINSYLAQIIRDAKVI